MLLAEGTSLGAFRILSMLGKGGMGEVYRAKDTKLDRDVAIKVLPEMLARDTERLLRFQREAKVLASLNHPHIAGIYGFEEQSIESQTIHFLILEYVEGETLSELLACDSLRIDDVLDLGRQIAEGLEAAHEKGVIHRDLKPSNVMVRADGTVKVLDFGLAKALVDEASGSFSAMDSPTITADYTRPGVILGTAAYMSPEQARGRPLDKRTDIWSFGVCLFEALAGARTFKGETATDLFAEIIKGEPDWNELPPETPTSIRTLLKRCLAKDRKRRLHDIADARLELQDAIDNPAASTSIDGSTAGHPRKSSWMPWVVTTSVAVVAVVMTFVTQSDDRSPPATTRLSVNIPEGYRLAYWLALAPDGESLAYTAENDAGLTYVFYRRLDEFESRKLEGTEGAKWVFFSPDGRWIGFSTEGVLKKVAVSGGAPISICRSWTMGAIWTEDDEIIGGGFGTGLFKVPATGGNPTTLTTLDTKAGEVSHTDPALILDKDTVLFTVGTGRGSYLATLSLSSGTWKQVMKKGAYARSIGDNLIAYAQQGQMQIAKLDGSPAIFRNLGTPFIRNVQWANWGGSEFAAFAYASNGTMAYTKGEQEHGISTVVKVDRSGEAVEIEMEPGRYLHPMLSPDGNQVALTRIQEGRGRGDIWIYDQRRKTSSRLSTSGTNYTPIWTPDGKHVTYVSNGNIISKVADGSAEAKVLLDNGPYERPQSWSSDSTALLFTSRIDNNDDLRVLTKDGKVIPIVSTPFDERSASFSPNGNWIAYSSNESGRHEVYVRAYPGPGARFMVSTSGGGEPHWSPKGDELFYRIGTRMMVAAVQWSPEFSIGTPKLLFEKDFLSQTIVWNYDVFPDGQHFVMIFGEINPPVREIRVVRNWLDDLKRNLDLN